MGTSDPRHPRSLSALALAVASAASLSTTACKHASRSSDPPLAASAHLGNERGTDGYPAALAGDGAVAAVIEDAVVGFGADGGPSWKTPLDVAPWLIALADGSVLVGDEKAEALVALDPANGHERWRVAIPATADQDDDRSPEAVARDGDDVVVALADGRFFRLGASHALTPMFAIDDALDTPDLLVTPDHGVVITDVDELRSFDRTGAPGARLVADEAIGGAVPFGAGHLAVTLDDQLVVIDLAGCAAQHAPVRLTTPVATDDDDCADCVLAAPTCVIARPDLRDVDEDPPSLLADGAIAVTDDDGLAVLGPDGALRWTSDAGAFGPLRTLGDTVVALTSQVGDDLDSAPTRVVALDAATGKPRWGVTLPARTDMIVDHRDVTLETAGDWLVAGYRGDISWIKPPAPPPAR